MKKYQVLQGDIAPPPLPLLKFPKSSAPRKLTTGGGALNKSMLHNWL